MGNVDIAQWKCCIAVCDDQPEALSAIVKEVHRSLPAHLYEICTYENPDALLASPVAFDIAAAVILELLVRAPLFVRVPAAVKAALFVKLVPIVILF